jgi:hypothetical protein
MACIFGVVRLLALVNPLGGIRPIVMGEMFCWLVRKALYLQFWDVLFFHLSLYQFGVTNNDSCEVVVHDIRTALDVHLDWVVLQVDVMNVFNTILCKAIFQKL